jgi:hypothetical protein
MILSYDTQLENGTVEEDRESANRLCPVQTVTRFLKITGVLFWLEWVRVTGGDVLRFTVCRARCGTAAPERSQPDDQSVR